MNIKTRKIFGKRISLSEIERVDEEENKFILKSKNYELSVYHMRHVSNKSDEKDGKDDWGYFAKGILE